jgi:excinuclease UvrABC helicase subunit UvrB
MEEAFHSSPLNRGQLFEKMVAQAYGMTQVESKNAKFTQSGDVIDSNGKHYQVKYNKATFSDERTLHNLMGV